jgi:DNA-directed RNA polymerase subunit alpha
MSEQAEFAMPSRLVIDEAKLTETYGKFIVEPLEKGYGHTLGNSLRRVLLSSMEGIAVSSIQIDGVSHEFSSIEGVVEDVTEIVLNFKNVLFECSGELPRKLELNVQKSGEVTAGDISADSVTRILNIDQVICTIDQERELRIEIEIDAGRGYRPADDNKRDDQPIGVIPIDSLFSPIRRVAYSVFDTRVGQRTDFDKLELEVWTDGRMGPADAVKKSARILADHLTVFTGIDTVDDDDIAKLITSPEDEALIRKLQRPVTDLELSVRAQNCLNNADIRTLGDLIQRGEPEMLKYRNFGQKSLNELKEKLDTMELEMGMELSENVRIALDRERRRLAAIAAASEEGE